MINCLIDMKWCSFFPEKYYVENFPEIFWKISGNFPQRKNIRSLFLYLKYYIPIYILNIFNI